MFNVGIITVSDKGSRGERLDESGRVIEEIVKAKGYNVVNKIIIPDEEDIIGGQMIKMADEEKLDLILTTGGTGFSPRDVTPEATIRVCDRMAMGIAEAIRSYSLQITPRAMLSRAASGIRKNTLIINLPGSPKAVREALEYIIDSLDHGLEILTDRAHDCARK